MSEPNITMTYGSYPFSPVPPISLKKEYTRTADGTIVGSIMKVILDGTLVAATGGASIIMSLQDSLRSAFDTDGKLFEIQCNGNPILSCYPRVNGPEFSPSTNNWVLTCPYSIELEFDDEPGPTSGFGVLGENTGIMPPFLRDAQESWNIEFIDDRAYYNLTLSTGIADISPYQLKLNHTISAVGKKRYTGDGLQYQAWENARQYVLPKLGYNSSFLTASGVLNIGAGVFSAYNHMRSNTVDESAGSYSVTESWLLVNSGNGIAGRALEDYTVDVKKSIDSDITTVSVQGSIQGLETRSYGTGIGDFTITETKIAAASGYWNAIKGSLKVYPRAQLFSADVLGARPLNPISLNNSFGYNPANGTITYTYEYNDRPSNCITGALVENISIADSNPTDVFAELPIPGRSAGPILQDIGTATKRTRDVSIDVVVAPPTGCTYALYNVNNPRVAVAAVFDLFYAELTGAYSQVFTHTNNENWEPKTGRYTAQRGWTYTNCT